MPLSRKTARCMSVAAFPRHCPKTEFFCQAPMPEMERVSALKQIMALAVFCLCGGQGGVLSWIVRR